MKYLIFLFLFMLYSNSYSQEFNENSFDFWVGTWEATWENSDGTSTSGTNIISKVLDGNVIKEEFEDPSTKFNGLSISILNFAKWLWLRDGKGGWHTNSGEAINWEKSTVGMSSVYYKVNGRLYYRYSRAWQWGDYYLNIKYGTNDKRYLLTFKIQK